MFEIVGLFIYLAVTILKWASSFIRNVRCMACVCFYMDFLFVFIY